MECAPLPPDEPERLQALLNYQILVLLQTQSLMI